jgi:hypothetical protein
MNKSLLISLSIVSIMAVATWRGCRYYWNPHYVSNKAVDINPRSLYNSDSSVAVVEYTLDIGARGFANYKTLLRKEDYQRDLSKFMLPVEYIEPIWRSRDTLEVIYEEGEAFRSGGNMTNVDKERDTVILNEIVILVKERRLNKQEAIDEFIKGNRL